MNKHNMNDRAADALDHRELNRDLDIFATDPLAGSGLPLWLPAGAPIRDELQKLAKLIARDRAQTRHQPPPRVGVRGTAPLVPGAADPSQRAGTDVPCMGTEQQWAASQDALRDAARHVLADYKLPLVDAVGEAAFYGPKLDMQVRDGRGHEEAIATVQLDFNQPERFDLTYQPADGSRHTLTIEDLADLASTAHQQRSPICR